MPELFVAGVTHLITVEPPDPNQDLMGLVWASCIGGGHDFLAGRERLNEPYP